MVTILTSRVSRYEAEPKTSQRETIELLHPKEPWLPRVYHTGFSWNLLAVGLWLDVLLEARVRLGAWKLLAVVV